MPRPSLHAPGEPTDAGALATREQLTSAIGRGELRVEYQPIVDLPTSRIVGAEALVRWQHPVLGNLPPSDFIPIAEASGGIVALGRFVLDAAVAVAVDWPQSPAGISRFITVNVSGRELHERDYAAYVLESLARVGLSPSNLRLEVIESFFDVAAAAVQVNLATLSERGVLMVVDDFGSGHSDLTRLDGIGASVIKIDRSLTATILHATDTAHTEGLAAILARAADDSIEVIAEGVETSAQVGWYANHGCVSAQGFYFAPSLSADALMTLLSSGGGTYA